MEDRVSAPVVVALRVIGILGIVIAAIYLTVHLLIVLASEGNVPFGPGTVMGFGGVISGVFFLAVAFIADKLDSIDQSLAARTTAAEEGARGVAETSSNARTTA